MLETDEFYFFYKHEFGQWTMRNITDVNGITYNCCEQYMMFQKAILFEDKEVANQILAEKNPLTQQQLGKKVKGFYQEIWDKYRYQVVWNGNWLKFTQYKDLQDRLIATGNKELVEASPVDGVWGVKRGLKDPLLLDRSSWNGLNLLGKVLMSVRFCLNQQRE